MKNFRTYQLAIQFYRQVCTLSMPRHLKEQLRRAASSIVLNLAEGYGKHSPDDQRRFYDIALGSLRESQAALDLMPEPCTVAARLADQLGGCIYLLVKRVR